MAHLFTRITKNVKATIARFRSPLRTSINAHGSSIDDLTLKADRDNNGSYETTEHVEAFTANASGQAEETATYDSAGNLTYDGVFQYAYDAWNRLVKVSKAYRTSGGTLTSGSTIATMGYDGLGRRISKAIANSGDFDCTYHFYYDGQRCIEIRNGSSQVLKQHVWGLGYIDELVQVGLNQDPQNATSGGSTENVCELYYWVMQDANYNVLGLVNKWGMPIERYEYTPYGQRQVYSHGRVLGDTDQDGDVDLNDLGNLTTVLGANDPDNVCDFDGDGDIDTADENILAGAYGTASFLNGGHKGVIPRSVRPRISDVPFSDPEFELFYEPIIMLDFQITVGSADASEQQTLYRRSLPWSLMAFPSQPEFLDVMVNDDGDVAVVVWNELGFAWAEVIVRDEEQHWKLASPKVLGDPMGKHSLGPAVNAAEISIDEQQAVILTLFHTDGKMRVLRALRSEEFCWDPNEK